MKPWKKNSAERREEREARERLEKQNAVTTAVKGFIPACDYMVESIHDEIAGIEADTLSYIPAPVIADVETHQLKADAKAWRMRLAMLDRVSVVLAYFSRTDIGARWLGAEGWTFWRIIPSDPDLLKTAYEVSQLPEADRQMWFDLVKSSHARDVVAMRDWRRQITMAEMWYISKDPTVLVKLAAFTHAEFCTSMPDEAEMVLSCIPSVMGVMDIVPGPDWLIESYLMLSSVAPIEVLVRHGGSSFE